MYIDNEYSKLFQIGMNFLFYLSVIDFCGINIAIAF